MSWVKTDDQMNQHPKVVSAGPFADLLNRRAITYSGQYLLDGKIPHNAVSGLVDWRTEPLLQGTGIVVDNYTIAQRLVDSRLWKKTEEGFEIHDYLKWNPSKEEVLRERDKEKARKDSGRAKQGRDSSGRISVAPGVQPDSDPLPPGVPAVVRPESGPRPGHVPPVPSPSPSHSPSENLFGGTSPAPRVPKAKNRTCCPASTDEPAVTKFVSQWKLDRNHREFIGFVDYHRGKGSVMADWSAAWRTWLRNQTRFAPKQTGQSRDGREDFESVPDVNHELVEMEKTISGTFRTRPPVMRPAGEFFAEVMKSSAGGKP